MSQAPIQDGEETFDLLGDESPANDNEAGTRPESQGYSPEAANDNAEMSDEDKEVISVMNGVADQVHEVYLHPSVEKGLFKAIDYVDETYLMKKAREVWTSNKFPDIAKWALIHIPQVHPVGPFVKILVRTGLLSYNEKAVSAVNDYDKMVLDKAITIGSLLEPALIPLKPLIKPIQRIMDAQEQVFDKMREHLHEKHNESHMDMAA